MHFSKPHPEYYLEIAGRIGWQPDECVMVGDDWGNDIAPAMRAGLRVYWVNTNADLLPESGSCARGTLADFGRWLTEGMLNAL
jgi:FMN phosphatase YigB (HAD superfamily)